MFSAPKFVGLDNFVRMFMEDDVFMTALSNTLVAAVVIGPIGYLISFVTVSYTHLDTVLTFPLVPENFQIGIKSSSEPTVIALDGSIRAQADDTDVTLVFTVTDAQGNTADTGNITVTVPGTVEKYPH